MQLLSEVSSIIAYKWNIWNSETEYMRCTTQPGCPNDKTRGEDQRYPLYTRSFLRSSELLRAGSATRGWSRSASNAQSGTCHLHGVAGASPVPAPPALPADQAGFAAETCWLSLLTTQPKRLENTDGIAYERLVNISSPFLFWGNQMKQNYL